MSSRAYLSFFILAVLFLQGCAITKPFQYEKPDVTVTSVRLLPSESLTPKFEILLFIVNPNDKPLPLKGVAYSVSLEGFKVLSGVSNQLPIVEAYGQEEIRLVASANLLSGLRLITRLIQTNGKEVNYSMDAKLDIGTLLPSIHVNEKGKLQLNGPA